jgi:SpoVK/Ycf46/Vps4 family AAA+-type ATPase
MMAKAVANATTASFIKMVGSEFVQKYLGEGPRMVRDVFRLARENAPAVIFIDEVDAIGTKRFDSQTGADREVQRILLELLNQMDGFDQDTNVKVSAFGWVVLPVGKCVCMHTCLYLFTYVCVDGYMYGCIYVVATCGFLQ